MYWLSSKLVTFSYMNMCIINYYIEILRGTIWLLDSQNAWRIAIIFVERERH